MFALLFTCLCLFVNTNALQSPRNNDGSGLSTWLAPLGSYDCHVHLFSPVAYPYSPGRSYSPVEANISSLYSMSAEITVDHQPMRYVFVQPSPYGTNNSLLVDTLTSLGGGKAGARGIAVVNISSTTDDYLSTLHTAGVRGLRINTESAVGITSTTNESMAIVSASARRIQDRVGWVVQLFVGGTFWAQQAAGIRALSQPVIADHFGGMKALSMLNSTLVNATSANDTFAALKQPGFAELLQLQKEGKVWIKFSGFYRASSQNTTGYADLEPLVKAFITNRPDRVIWASDWPHTGDAAQRVGRPIDYPEQFRIINQTLLNQNLRKWIPDDLHWNQMFYNNPRCVYNLTDCQA